MFVAVFKKVPLSYSCPIPISRSDGTGSDAGFTWE